MPLIKCPDCQTEVSDQAVSCIKCGRPFAKLAAEDAFNQELRREYASKQLIGATMLYMQRHPGVEMGRAKEEVERRLGLPHTPPAKQSPLLLAIGFLMLLAALWLFFTGKLFK